MPNELKIGRVYRHFKGDFYLVEAVANDSETGEPFVVYRKLYGDGGLWLRPLAMFLSPVDRAKYPDAAQEYRFDYLLRPSPTIATGTAGSGCGPLPCSSAPWTGQNTPMPRRNTALNCRRSPAPPGTDAVKRIHFYFGFTETFSDFLYCKSLHKAL